MTAGDSAGRVVALVHVDSPSRDPLGLIGDELTRRGYAIERHAVVNAAGVVDTDFPSADGAALVLVMGADHCSFDPAHEAWVQREVAWMRSAVAAGTPTLGICFGAQLLALAAGGSVELAPVPEFGAFEVSGPTWDLGDGPWLQWHSDRVVLDDADPEVQVLATSPAAIQAFRWRSALGLQFHPEVDLPLLKAWLDADREDPTSTFPRDRVWAEWQRYAADAAPRIPKLVDEALALRSDVAD